MDSTIERLIIEAEREVDYRNHDVLDCLSRKLNSACIYTKSLFKYKKLDKQTKKLHNEFSNSRGHRCWWTRSVVACSPTKEQLDLYNELTEQKNKLFDSFQENDPCNMCVACLNIIAFFDHNIRSHKRSPLFAKFFPRG